LDLKVVVEGDSAQIVGERERENGRGGNPMGKGPESRVDVDESPSRVPEWPLCSVWSGVFMLKSHSMSPTRAFVYAGLLTPDGEVVDYSIQQ
jgi:hypothetical protein